MGIPQEIRSVERPPNTVVLPPGRDGSYPVRERIGCKREKGQNRPVSGCIVGHIVNGTYIADAPDVVEARRKNIGKKRNNDTAEKADGTVGEGDVAQSQGKGTDGSRTAPEPEQLWEGLSNTIPKTQDQIRRDDRGIQVLDWGTVVFAYMLIRPLFSELALYYAVEDVKLIAAMVILNFCYPKIKDYQMHEKYIGSVLKYLIPNISVDIKNVRDFQEALGQRYSQIVSFVKSRTAGVHEYEPIMIDGMLKANEEKQLSAPSRVTKDRGAEDTTVLVLFSGERHEPICSMCFSGNLSDADSFPRFVEECGIVRGILIGDKGFPTGSIRAWARDNPELHFLLPLPGNSNCVAGYHLSKFQDYLKDRDTILYKKEYDEKDHVWQYSFCNASSAGGDHTASDHHVGDIDLISDLDLPPERAYALFNGRSEIEVSLRYDKLAPEVDGARVSTDPSVIGAELINLLTSILNCRMTREFRRLNLLKDAKTLKEARETLQKAQIVQPNENEPWLLRNITKRELSILEQLGLIAVNAAVPMGSFPPIQVKRGN